MNRTVKTSRSFVGPECWIDILALSYSVCKAICPQCLRISRRLPFFNLTLEPAHLFRISHSRHVWTISRSPQRGSREGNRKNVGASPFFAHSFIFNHVVLHSLPPHLLPFQYWLKPSIERWGRELQASFRSYVNCLTSWLMASTGNETVYPSSITW